MAYIQKDRVKETTVTNGTGAITLAGAAVGFQAFSAVMAVSDTCYYVIVSATGADWETGTGTYSAASVLTRTTVLSSSNSGNAVSFTSGTKDVFMGPVAERVTDIAHGGTGATTAAQARTNLGVGAGTVTSASVVSANGFGGSVATATTTPAITLTTSITGVLKGNSTAISAAIAGTDYVTPTGSAAGLTNFPTLNQNTTGNAATVTTNANLTGHVTSSGNAAVLGSFTSAQLLAALSDETGTGANVFAISPTLVTPLSNNLSAVAVASGAGNSLILTAGAGVTSGAGGSLILQAGLQATSGGDGKVIVKQVAGQTSNLQEWQNSAGTALGAVDSAGRVGIGTASPTQKLDVAGIIRATYTGPLTAVEIFGTDRSIGSAGGGHIAIAANVVTISSTISFLGTSAQLIVKGGGATSGSGALNVINSNSTSLLFVRDDGNVGIGTTSPNANAILDIVSTTKAFMPPRMTTVQRDAVASPTAGMVIYNSTTNKLNVYTTAWEAVTSA